MIVENYTQDFDYGQRLSGKPGTAVISMSFQSGKRIKADPATIAKRKYDRIIREAKRDYLTGFGIIWSEYHDGVAIFDEMTTCQVEFVHRITGRKIILTDIWFHEKTGAILQAGSNYGSLTL